MTATLPAAAVDRPNRILGDRERRMVDAHLPILRLWSLYLTAIAPRRTLAEAVAEGAPLLCRPHRRGTNPLTNLPYLAPVLVRPDLVERALWHLLSARGLPEGVERMPGPGLLSTALEVMGLDNDSVRHSTSQRPAGEPHRWHRPYRREGWYQISGEVWQRLSWGNYVPVLTPLMGRPSTRSALTESRAAPEPLPRRARHRALAKDRALMAGVLRDYLRTAEPSCLLTTAVASRRPLVVRRVGRPADAPVALPVRTDSVLVSAAALAEHAQGATQRLELPMLAAWWTRDSAAALLDALADDESVPVAAVPRFSPMDVGRPTKYRGWYRVDLGWANAGDLDVEALTAEWREHEGAADRAAAKARAEAAALEAEFEREFRYGDGVEETRA